MNHSQIDKLVEAVLYEGFILYPYRPSVKNTQRWTFGGLYPPEFCHSQASAESPSMQMQCLVEGSRDTQVDITLRFLRLVARQVVKLDERLPVWPTDEPLRFAPVDLLTVGDRQYRAWQEAVEQRVHIDRLRIGDLTAAPRRVTLDAAYRRQFEPVYDDGRVAGLIVRTQQALNGTAEVHAELVADGCFRLTVRATNKTRLPPSNPLNRDEALLRTFAAANAVIVVEGGELVSQFDPPDERRELAAANQNQGWWPVLVGDAPNRGAMLAAPIILYDYPQIAPESPTGLFDSTEIDEILSLRIMTLTDDEKQAMRAIDPRSRDLLERVESLDAEGLLQLHGATRDVELDAQSTRQPPFEEETP